MASRGDTETAKLQENINEQLNRLLVQLQDLEELKEDLDEEEYQETKKDTLDQLNEFKASLDKMVKGDMTLVDSLNAVQLAIQGAVSQAFQTPEVIRMFAKKQPGQLRERLASLEREQKLKNISEDTYKVQAVEILAALKKLGQELSPEEAAFLSNNMTQAMADFEQVESEMAGDQQKKVLSTAAAQIGAANK